MTSVNENSGLLGHVKDHSSVADAESDLEEAVGKAFPPSEPFLSRLSPLFILVFLVLCQLVNYFDRGAVSALVKPLGEYFELSKFEQGVIGGSFMLGYMVFAPLAGVLSQYIRLATFSISVSSFFFFLLELLQGNTHHGRGSGAVDCGSSSGVNQLALLSADCNSNHLGVWRSSFCEHCALYHR